MCVSGITEDLAVTRNVVCVRLRHYFPKLLSGGGVPFPEELELTHIFFAQNWNLIIPHALRCE